MHLEAEVNCFSGRELRPERPSDRSRDAFHWLARALVTVRVYHPDTPHDLSKARCTL